MLSQIDHQIAVNSKTKNSKITNFFLVEDNKGKEKENKPTLK